MVRALPACSPGLQASTWATLQATTDHRGEEEEEVTSCSLVRSTSRAASTGGAGGLGGAWPGNTQLLWWGFNIKNLFFSPNICFCWPINFHTFKTETIGNIKLAGSWTNGLLE